MNTVKKAAGSLSRTWLAVGFGVLIGKGLIDKETAEAAIQANSHVVEGIAGAIFVQAWSLVEKYLKLPDLGE